MTTAGSAGRGARRLLLDTHAWLWWYVDDPRLGPGARVAITEAESVYLSVASVWEMSIKASLGRLTLPDDLPGELERDGMLALPITLPHALTAGTLPPHHRDPFDRLLIAQAQVEALVLVTADADIARYDVAMRPAGC